MKKLAAIALIMLGIGVLIAFVAFDQDEISTKFKGDPYLQEKSVDASAIRSIRTETDTFNVTFVRGNRDDIGLRLEGDVSGKLMDDIIFKADTKGDTLNIEANTKDRFSIGITIVNLKLTVELPEKHWNSIDIITDTGNITVDQLQSDNMKVKSDTGNLKFSNNVTNELVFDTDTGNATFTDVVGSLKGETDTGNVRIETDELHHNIAIKSDTGNITINVEKHPTSASIHIKKDVGNSKVEWGGFSVNKESGSNLKGIIGSGEIKINLESDTGNIKLGNR